MGKPNSQDMNENGAEALMKLQERKAEGYFKSIRTR